MEAGGKAEKGEKAGFTGVKASRGESPVPGVRGGGISISPGWLVGELGGGGGRGWERKKKKTNCVRH